MIFRNIAGKMIIAAAGAAGTAGVCLLSHDHLQTQSSRLNRRLHTADTAANHKKICMNMFFYSHSAAPFYTFFKLQQ